MGFKYIGDKNCINNAINENLRCAINPDGPCESCNHFETRPKLERLRRDFKILLKDYRNWNFSTVVLISCLISTTIVNTGVLLVESWHSLNPHRILPSLSESRRANSQPQIATIISITQQGWDREAIIVAYYPEKVNSVAAEFPMIETNSAEKGDALVAGDYIYVSAGARAEVKCGSNLSVTILPTKISIPVEGICKKPGVQHTRAALW